MIGPRRLERHLRESLRQPSTPVRVGPYTCFFHPEAPFVELNVAVPDELPEGRRVPLMDQQASGLAAVPDEDAEYALMMVEAQFRARKRVPRIEFIAECHPDLPDALIRAGFAESMRVPILVSTAKGARTPSPVPGLEVEALLPSSPWETMRRYLDVQREAYAFSYDIPTNAPKDAWSALDIAAGVLALIDGEPVGAGGFTAPSDGLCEIRGLAVAPSARRRGVGSFLLHALARVALEGDLEGVLAIPDGPATARLAKRAGYTPAATLLAFTAEAASAQ